MNRQRGSVVTIRVFNLIREGHCQDRPSSVVDLTPLWPTLVLKYQQFMRVVGRTVPSNRSNVTRTKWQQNICLHANI